MSFYYHSFAMFVELILIFVLNKSTEWNCFWKRVVCVFVNGVHTQQFIETVWNAITWLFISAGGRIKTWQKRIEPINFCFFFFLIQNSWIEMMPLEYKTLQTKTKPLLKPNIETNGVFFSAQKMSPSYKVY